MAPHQVFSPRPVQHFSLSQMGAWPDFVQLHLDLQYVQSDGPPLGFGPPELTVEKEVPHELCALSGSLGFGSSSFLVID
jgi:hypothetical protein